MTEKGVNFEGEFVLFGFTNEYLNFFASRPKITPLTVVMHEKEAPQDTN